MSLAAPSEAQIRHYVAQIRRKAPHAGLIGIRTPVEWKGPGQITVGGEHLPIVVGRSPLQIREELLGVVSEDRPAVLLTALEEAALGGDVIGRLARHRLYAIDSWQIVLGLFRASSLDSRLSPQRWLADALLEILPAEGPDPVPTGVLDYRSAWTALLRHGLGLVSPELDLRAVLEWASEAVAIERYKGASNPVREGLANFLEETAGDAARLVLGCIEAGHGDRVVAIGLACRSVFTPDDRAVAGEARIRLEPYVGSRSIDRAAGLAWASEAEALVARRVERKDKSGAARLLAAADTFLADDLGAAELARGSRFLPSAFKQRLEEVGTTLEAALEQKLGARASERVAQAVQAAVEHVDAGPRDLLVRALEMLPRLVRWMERRETTPKPESFAEAARCYLVEGCFVDWARSAIRAGLGSAPLARAIGRLDEAVSTRREEENRTFASRLAAWSEHPAAGDVLPIERVLDEIVAPLAASRPVLLLVFDGMGLSAFQELLEDIEQHGWIEIAPEADLRPIGPAITALPSVTEYSRASLLAGALCRADRAQEKLAFESHQKLRQQTSSAHPPRLLHKGELRMGGDGSLLSETRTLLLDPARRVLGVVVNAIDDHLERGDQINIRWDCQTIAPLHQLFEAAADAGRVVILASDHGHVIETGTTQRRSSAGERWRMDDGSLDEGEVAVSGPRVLPPKGARIVMPWSERLRYGPKKNGYHGGATPQEVVAPLAVLSSPAAAVPGWADLPPRAPEWWYPEAIPAAPAPSVAAAPPPPARRPRASRPAARETQVPLFGDAQETASPVSTPVAAAAAAWVDALLGSELFHEQRRRASRQPMPDERIRVLLGALDAYGGTLTRTALARRLGIQEARLRGILATFRKLLNVDGYAVLSVDESGESVSLNRELLFIQFGLERR